MIALFKKNTLTQILLILAISLLCWGRWIINPMAMLEPTDTAPLYVLLYSWLSPYPYLCTIIALALIIVEAVFFNALLVKYGLSSNNTLMPTATFIMAMSATNHTLTPFIIINGLLLVVLYQVMLHSTPFTLSVNRISNATALISICGLFYYPAFAFILTYLFIVLSYRLYTWRDWAVMLLGLAAPLILLFGFLFLSNNWEKSMADVLGTMPMLQLQTEDIPVPNMLCNIVLTIVGFIGIVQLLSERSEHVILWRKNAQDIAYIVPSALVVMLFSSLFPVNISLFAMPIAIGEALFFLRRRKRQFVADALFIILIVATVVC
ncbi:MAG: hypothetical protein IJ761_04920 [Bacteroidales bacterium]|nr:hypothetical protein [Bacteroidales bacterium]